MSVKCTTGGENRSTSDVSLSLFRPNSVNCVQTLEGHVKDVTSCSFHDSSILATASSDKTIRLWKIAENDDSTCFVEELVSPLAGHSYAVNSVSFAPQRGLLASGSTDGIVFLWDVKIGEKLACLHHESGASVRCCVFSPFGSVLASGADDGSICLWDCSSFTLAKKLNVEDAEASVETADFSPDGEYLIVGTSTGRIIVFNADPRTAHSVAVAVHADAHDLGVTSVCFRPSPSSPPEVTSRQIFVTGGTDCAVKLWELVFNSWKGTAEVQARGKPMVGHSGIVMCVRFHPTENVVFSAGGDKTVRIWDVEKGVCISICQDHQRYITCCSVSGDGRWLATGSNDRTVKIWKLDGDDEKELSPKRTGGELWAIPGARLVQPSACWSVEDVCEWLDDLGLQQYTHKFREKRVGGAELESVTGKILEVEFGMTNSTHRVRLLNELQRLLRKWEMKPEQLQKIPVEFFCPITHNVMIDPVVTKDGYTYERSAITEWLTKKRSSPLTNQVMISTELVPNLTLKAVMNRFLNSLPNAPVKE